tara:strand:+ start:1351 stop:3576 length:2226 start_codon:yes stop_codon:yes gene_type:complete
MNPWTKNISGDFNAGINVAIVSLPTALGIGLIAVSSLGPEYASLGVLAGLYGVLFITFVAPFTGTSAYQYFGPGPASAGILSGLAGGIIADPQILELLGNNSSTVTQLAITSMFLCSLLVGIIHVLVGQLRIGNLIKLVPKTVIAGILNGTVLLIIIYQIPYFVGLEEGQDIGGLVTGRASINPLDILAGTAAIAGYFMGKTLIPKFPPLLLGILIGTLLHLLLGVWLAAFNPGQTIGAIPFALPRPGLILDIQSEIANPAFSLVWLRVLTAAGAISLITSIGALITAATVDSIADTRHSPVGELTGLGIGNIVAAIFYGLPSGGSPARVLTAYEAGGRTRLSHLISAVFIAAAIMGLGPLLSAVPLSAVAGVLFVMIIGFFDSWTILLLRKAFFANDLPQRKRILFNLALVVLIMTLIVVTNLVIAIVVGLVIELLRFLLQSEKTIIRAQYHGGMLHSNTVRVPQDMETLKQHGHSIGILSLQGSLFFGNTDYLSRRIAEFTATASMLVLDFQRITDIDTSACMVLDRVDKNLRRKGITIFFGGIKPGDDIHQLLLEMDINSVINKGFMYPDLNNALSEAEDKILEIYGESGDPNRELKLSETIIFDGFSESEFELMDMQRKEFNKDEIIIKEGTVADGFFVLVKGRVSIYKEDDSGGMELVDFGAGVSIGEMAVLASTTRTASVVASSDAVLYFISAKKLQALRESHPIVSERIVMNLASSLSRRLASASETIHMLQKT